MGQGPGAKRRKISWVRYAVGAVVLAALSLVLAAFAVGRIGNYEVISNSMAPTLLEGDRVLVDQRPTYAPEVGDVVVLDDPESPGSLLAKRVAASAGQRVEINNGYIMVDGKKWAPPRQSPMALPPGRTMEPLVLGKGEVFVLGDNLPRSEDSTTFGPVKITSVKGKLWFIYWPPHRMGKVK